MELRDYLRVLRSRWLFVAVSIGACTAVAAALAWTRSPTYTARTQLFISISGPSNDPSATYQGGLFSQERVLSYAQIVSSPPVLRSVIDELGLPETVPQLQDQITASVPTNTVLLNIAVNNHSARRAAAIARVLAHQFIRFAGALEQPIGGKPSSVKVSVTSPAQTPTSASSPRKPIYLAIGILLGLVLGIGGGVLRELLDRRVRNDEDASAATGAAVLGSVAASTGSRGRPPVVTSSPASAQAEAYRRLRTSLRTLVDDHGVRSFVITGADAGDNTTAVAANVGIVFAQAGYRVVMVDGNLRRPRLAALLGASAPVGVANVVVDDVPVDAVLQTWSSELPLEIVGGGPEVPNPSELVGSLRFFTMLEELTSRFDIVVIDAPALLESTDAVSIARVTGGAVVVARVDATRVERLAAAVAALDAANATTLGLVLTHRTGRKAIGGGSGTHGYGRASRAPRTRGDDVHVATPLRSSTEA